MRVESKNNDEVDSLESSTILQGDAIMPTIKKPSDERYLELKKLGKLYLALLIVGWLVFLMQKFPTTIGIPVDDNILELAKSGFQAMIANQNVKKVCMLGLLLYTAFVGIETIEFLRVYFAQLYSIFKSNKSDN